MLSPEILSAAFPSKTLNASLFVFDELPSTNTFALEIARHHITQGTIVLTDRQTAGRGRMQRIWFSPAETNIYGSIIFSLRGQLKDLGWIPLMAGVAIAQAIENTTNITIRLKWPNDILINEQKLGGILCESFKKDSAQTCVVIGFGINVNLTESALPKDLKQMATSLLIHSQTQLDRHELLKSIIPSLEQGWDTLITQGPSTCQRKYRNYCSTLGKEIVIQFPDGSTLKGLAQSIGEQGQLQIIPSSSDSQGRSARIVDVHAGDIQHIRKSEH